MNDVKRYTNRILSINRSRGKTLHKPLLLLSLIDLIEQAGITINRVPIEEELYHLFDQYWRKIIKNEDSKIKVLQPLHYLKNDGLWSISYKDGQPRKNKFSSKERLSKDAAFGQLDEGLFLLLQDADMRDYFRMVIVDAFLLGKDTDFIKQPEYAAEVQLSIFEDIQVKYTTRTIEKTGYTRSWKFQKSIMHIYQDTCCVSKLQVEPSAGIIEACHIQPHSESGNQKIQNGIALSINLHRAFDNGLISIGDEYQVLVSKRLKESSSSPYNIRQFAQQKILLPKKELYYPSQEYLAEHREKFNF